MVFPFSFASPLHYFISLIILLIRFLFSPPFAPPPFLFSNSSSSNSSSLFPSPLYNSPYNHTSSRIFHLFSPFEGLTTEESPIPNNLRVPNYGSPAAKVKEMVKSGKDTFNRNKIIFNSFFVFLPYFQSLLVRPKDFQPAR